MTGMAWLFCALLAAPLGAGEGVYRDFSSEVVEFYGPAAQDPEPQTLAAVRLGVLGPGDSAAGRQLRQGVEMAVAETNAGGGLYGRPCQVVFRSDGGAWSGAARQMARLAYEDEVWVAIGALDGARAHAAELVAARAWVPLLAAGAGDRSLDYANVPWVFRYLPDDGAQAECLLAAAQRRGWKRLVLASEGRREGRTGAQRLLEAAQRRQQEIALHLEYDPHRPEALAPRLGRAGAEALIVWGRPQSATLLIAALRRLGLSAPVLGPAALATPEVAAQSESLGKLLVAAPLDLAAPDPRLQRFRRRYRERTGEEAACTAMLAYDAARLALESLARAGLNRVRLRRELARAHFEGLSGPLSFNGLGGRRQGPVLLVLCKGRWTRFF